MESFIISEPGTMEERMIKADYFVFAGYGGYEFFVKGNDYQKLVAVVPTGCIIVNEKCLTGGI